MSKTWGQGGTAPNWRRLRLQTLERDQYICQIQLAGVCIHTASQVDHIRSLASIGVPRHGAPDGIDGLQSVCGPCHDVKSRRESNAAKLLSDARRAQRKKLPKGEHPGTLKAAT